MSKTHRKPRWYSEYSDAEFINRELEHYYRRPYRRVPVRKTAEEFAADREAATIIYNEKIAANGGKDYYEEMCRWSKVMVTRYIHKPYTSVYKSSIMVPYTKEECIEDAKAKRAEMQRDGYGTETVRNTGFKQDAAKKLRRDNKRYCDDVVADKDVDHLAYHSRKESKHIVWRYW